MIPTLEDLDLPAGYDPETDTYHASVGSSADRSLGWAIVSLASVATEEDPIEMEPLYDAIDPDALESLFRAKEPLPGQVDFEYHGCRVTATSDGEVRVSGVPAEE